MDNELYHDHEIVVDKEFEVVADEVVADVEEEYNSDDDDHYPFEEAMPLQKADKPKELPPVEEIPKYNKTKLYTVEERLKNQRTSTRLIFERGFIGISCHKIKFTRISDPCGICGNVKEENQKIFRIPCGHEFHDDCLLDWLDSHSTCPDSKCKFDIKWRFPEEAKPTSENKYLAGQERGIAEEDRKFYGLDVFVLPEDEDSENCRMCGENILNGQRVIETNCGHLFHAACMKDYLLFCNTCFKCNEDLRIPYVESMDEQQEKE